MVQEVAGRSFEFEAGLRHATTGKLSLSAHPAVNGYILRIRKG